MRKYIIFIILLAITTTLGAQPKHEVRAVWLTTIGGLDWPHSYYAGEQQEELTHILDQLQAAGINTVLLQTRIRATTIYPSSMEPWDGCISGKPGKAPAYDPLQLAIDECHRRGMELHAWVVTMPIGKWNAAGCAKLRHSYPTMVKRIGEEGYMNPESRMTADYMADLCEEIVSRYDVDGIHLDYIRYPETWRVTSSRQQAREHITRIVRAVHDRVKLLKPWVKMSCSPIGKYDDLAHVSSRGWNAYTKGAQDAQEWLREGWMDALFPMMYFRGNQFYPFAVDWEEHACGRMVSAGLGVYMLSPREQNWPLEEMERQMNVSRQLGMGHCFFRSKFLTDNVKGIYDFTRDFNRHPALIPPMEWAKTTAPTAPYTLDVERTSEGDNLTWTAALDRSDGDYLMYNVYASTSWPVDTQLAEHLVATRLRDTQLSIRRQAGKPRLYYAVTAQNRYGQESAPCQLADEDEPVMTATDSNILLPNDGQWMLLPRTEVLDAEYVAVCSMLGNIITTETYGELLDISQLSEGMYQLKTLDRHGHVHRLGYFIIKRNHRHGKNHIGY